MIVRSFHAYNCMHSYNSFVYNYNYANNILFAFITDNTKELNDQLIILIKADELSV